jgi:hypothetical protein
MATRHNTVWTPMVTVKTRMGSGDQVSSIIITLQTTKIKYAIINKNKLAMIVESRLLIPQIYDSVVGVTVELSVDIEVGIMMVVYQRQGMSEIDGFAGFLMKLCD